MKKRIYLLLFSFFSFAVSGQTISPSVKHLASQITDGIHSDSLKVRAIYEWVTDNIAYDIDLFNEMNIKTVEQYAEAQKSEKVIRRKKAVCMGYTNLFQDLCNASGIKAYSVPGYCKSIDPRTNVMTFSSERHSWNAVKINNKWYLCDPTWSAGSINMRTGLFVKNLNEEFYLTDGKKFIKRHIPLDPLWQLLDNPISMQEFRYGQKPARMLKFNYLDTLKVFESLAVDQQKLNADFRSLRFDGSNDEAKSSIGYYYAKKAEVDSKAWHDLVMSFMNKNTSDSYRRAREQKDRVYSLLASIENNMNQARYYYSLVPPDSELSRMALNNMRNADNYLHFIEQNRDNLAKYYESLKKMKY
jgi:transglutaminase/protease-like cytokinesis protein 3